MTHSQLLKGFKCEPKQKTTEEGGVGARSLAHNTLRGRGACWSSGMGLGRVDKLHSLTPACTQPTQSGQCIVGAPFVLSRAMGNTTHKTHHGPDLGEATTFPLIVYFVASHKAYIQMAFLSRDSQVGVPNSRQLGLPRLWSPHNFASRPPIEVRSKAKLQLSLRAFQRYVARHLQTNKLGRFLTFSGRESNWQFDSRPFFWP